MNANRIDANRIDANRIDANRVDAPAVRRWRMHLDVDELESKVATALDQTGEVIGLAAAGATRDPDAPTAWELYSINVVAQQQGSGLADDLIQTTATDRDLTVWVLAENARAQRFYDRHGFRIEGATRRHEVTGAPEMRMIRQYRAADR